MNAWMVAATISLCAAIATQSVTANASDSRHVPAPKPVAEKLEISAANEVASKFPMPTGDWVVGPINVKASNGKGYCSMRNTYPNGVSVVFARDDQGSNSIAYDFHSKDLDPGNQYPLYMMAGDSSRSMTGLAATRSVMIAQMGKDSGFYSALLRSDTLSIKTRDKSYDFNLKDTPSAFDALDQCVEGMSAGKKQSYVKVSSGGTLPAAFDDIFASPMEKAPVPRAYVNVTQPEVDKAFDISGLARDDLTRQEINELKKKNRELEQRLSETEYRSIIDDEKASKAEAKSPTQRVRLIDEVLLSSHLIDDTLEGNIYRWNDRNINAVAQELPLKKGDTLQSTVARYLEMRGAACEGDYAHTTGDAVKSTIAIETACIHDDGRGVTEVLLFAQDGKSVVMIGQKTQPQDIDQAIDVRDRMVRYVHGL